MLRIGGAVDGSVGFDALDEAVSGKVAKDLPGALLVDRVADLVESGDGTLGVPLAALGGDRLGEAVFLAGELALLVGGDGRLEGRKGVSADAVASDLPEARALGEDGRDLVGDPPVAADTALQRGLERATAAGEFGVAARTA